MPEQVDVRGGQVAAHGACIGSRTAQLGQVIYVGLFPFYHSFLKDCVIEDIDKYEKRQAEYDRNPFAAPEL